MVREGKRAEYTICKKAGLRSPVSAQTSRPQKGRVYDGMKGAATVKRASVILPDLEPQNQEAEVHLLHGTRTVQAVKLQESVPVRLEQIREKPVSGENVSAKKLHCRTADKEITLQSLFHHA